MKRCGVITAVVMILIAVGVAWHYSMRSGTGNELGMTPKPSEAADVGSGDPQPVNALYFYSQPYEKEYGRFAVSCPQTKNIDWSLAIDTLSAYMQYVATGSKDFGPAAIQRHFDAYCERDMWIYETYRSTVVSPL